jgi:hypothetical protein
MQNNLIIPNSQEFFKEHALIKPPNVSSSDIPKRYYRYIIDSRDRNLHYFKSPNKYEIKLSEDVHDVQSVELISFDVPFTKYFINQYNNTFNLSVGSTVKQFIIPIGDYPTGESIVLELNKACPSGINFTFDTINNKITITNNSTEDVTLLCKGPSERKNDYAELSPTYTSQLMKIVGLDIDDKVVQLSEKTFTFPYKVNLKHDKYIIMNLGQAKVNVSENNSTNKSFAIIKKDELENKFIETNYKKTFNPPINSLTTLSLSFNDYEGNLYDFQNQDHMVELLFCCFKQTRCYNDVFNSVNI